MSLKQEIESFKTRYSAYVDENVYCALVLALVAKRHVLISSRDTHVAEYEVGTVLNAFWKLGATIMRVQNGTDVDQMEELLEFLTQTRSGQLSLVYVVHGVEKLGRETQGFLADVMKMRRVKDHKKNVWRCGELFTIVGITSDAKDLELSRTLKDEFWFEQPYTANYELHDKIDLFSQQHLTKDPSTTDRIRHFLSMFYKIKTITMVPEIKRYIYDVIIFVRNHRCVFTGLPTRTIGELEVLCRTLCVVFEREFVIPTIVKLAARKLIPLKIVMVPPELEPSLQYGSDPDLVKELMKRATPELVVENCLSKVAPPL